VYDATIPPTIAQVVSRSPKPLTDEESAEGREKTFPKSRFFARLRSPPKIPGKIQDSYELADQYSSDGAGS